MAKVSPCGTVTLTPSEYQGRGHGDVACDSYHRYKEDIALAKRLDLKSYRFSISLASDSGQRAGTVNPKGLDDYKRASDEVQKHGSARWPPVSLGSAAGARR